MGLLDRLAKKQAAQTTPQPKPSPRRPAPMQPQAAQLSPEVEARLAQLEAEREAMSAAMEAEKARRERSERQAADLKAKADAAERSARAERIRSTAARIAAALNVHDSEEVADILGSQLALGPDGSLVSATDAAKSGEDVIKGYVEKKPWHLRPQAASGSGAAPKSAVLPGAPAAQKHDPRTNEGLNAMMREWVEQAAAPPSKN